MDSQPQVYIKAATHISLQQPLSELWMEQPAMPEGSYVRSQDPNFREWLSAGEARRLGKILKRALVTARHAMTLSGIDQPGAIITGTGLGCIENTEIFLRQLCQDGEQMLSPTSFMQSTHNTISSLIAISTRCHAYNSTYSHKSLSFDSALYDAMLQLVLGDITTALVTGNDEMTPSYFTILSRTGYVGRPGMVPAGEASAALMLTTSSDDALCRIENMDMFQTDGQPLDTDFGAYDAVLTGVNGNGENDAAYDSLLALAPEALPRLRYKHLFGECFTASALGVYAAAQCVAKGYAPAAMRCDGASEPLPVRRILVLNHSDAHDVSTITLSSR